MKNLTIGVLGTSLKENDYRIPIHPDHINEIDSDIKKQLLFEKGYAEKFGVVIEDFLGIGGIFTREDIFKKCDIVLAQVCIDNHFSVFTWESMHEWKDNGEFIRHLFNKNNEVAGYAAVLDSSRLLGIDGNYGPVRKASIIGFGSVGRGAA